MSKKKSNENKYIVPFVVISIFVFTGIAIYLQFVTSVELSAALITCFFAFCTGELWMLASIKKTKIINGFEDDPSTPENEAEIYSEIYMQGYDAGYADALKAMEKNVYNPQSNVYNNIYSCDDCACDKKDKGNGVG